MAQDTEVSTEPELERRTRRKFSSADKRRLLAEYDNLVHGEKGAWLRRQGLYAAQLTGWRRTLEAQGSEGLEPKTGGRKPKDSRDRRIEELEREKARLAHRLDIAEESIALQKKLFALIEDASNERSQ